MKIKGCPICESSVNAQVQDYHTGKINFNTGQEIVITNVKTMHCVNSECRHQWLPFEEEDRIDQLQNKALNLINKIQF
jgi:hypothetical protein